MFRAIISPILRSTRLCLQLVVKCTGDAACWWQPHPGHQQAASPVHYTKSCKQSLVLLRMGEIIARNMLSWLKLLIIKLLLLYLISCLCYYTEKYLNIFMAITVVTLNVFTGWFRRNMSYVLKEFLRLYYVCVIKKTYIPSWTLTAVIERDLKKMTAVIYLLIIKYIIKRGEFAVYVTLTPLHNI